MSNRKFLESLEKSMSQAARISEIVNRQNSMLGAARLLNGYIETINRVNFSTQLPGIYSALHKINSTEWFKAIEISNNIFNNIQPLILWSDTYSKQIASMTENLSLALKRITADFAAMNLSALNLSSFGVFDKLLKLVEYHQDSAEAFKSAGWNIAPTMNRELREKVVFFYQQNKTRYISQIILGYYHKNNFEKLKNTVAEWETNPLFSSRMHIFKAALKAHCEGNYILSVPTLLPQIEGILNEYVKINNLEARLGKIEKVYTAVLGNLDGYPLTSWVIATTLLYQLQTNTFTFTDFETEFNKSANKRKTTRHTVLHGIATNYDKPIHSLKAFVLLDALSSLQELSTENPA